MFMCQGHDGEDVRMLDSGGLWHSSFLGWEHHVTCNGAISCEVSKWGYRQMYRPIKWACPAFFFPGVMIKIIINIFLLLKL